VDESVSEVSAPDTIQQGSDVGPSTFALTGNLFDPFSGMLSANTFVVFVSGNSVVCLSLVKCPAALSPPKYTEKIVNGKHGEHGFHDVAVKQDPESRPQLFYALLFGGDIRREVFQPGHAEIVGEAVQFVHLVI
jgi:hypothetical protein